MSANLKRGFGVLLAASVVFLSIFAMHPDADVDHNAGYTSSELSIRETVDGSVTSTSYVNSDGVITDAIDMGYATVRRMQDDNGRVVEERYLDANGDPVARYGDYCGLSYEYDETSTVITLAMRSNSSVVAAISWLLRLVGLSSRGHLSGQCDRSDRCGQDRDRCPCHSFPGRSRCPVSGCP